MGLKESGYYTLRDILGYNAKYNFVLSDRGRGKSWDAKHFIIRQEGKFVCLYRTQPDMASAMLDWIDPLVDGDDEHDPIPATSFEWMGNDKDGWTLNYEGQPKGYFRYLTQVNHIKQEVFPDDVNWMWLDEFIPLVYKKLPGMDSEGDAIRTIVKTIEHDTVRTRQEKGLKPLRVIAFANPFTWNNPILSYFKIVPRGYGIWRVGPDIVCENLPPFEREKKDRKMTVDEFLGDEVNKNQGYRDEMAYVGDMPKGAIPVESIRLGTKFFTLYKSDNKRVYVKQKGEHTLVSKEYSGYVMNRVYGTLEGLQENEVCIDGTKHLEVLKSMAYRGMIYYENINTKFDFLNSIV